MTRGNSAYINQYCQLREATVLSAMNFALVSPSVKKIQLDSDLLQNCGPISNWPFVSKNTGKDSGIQAY